MARYDSADLLAKAKAKARRPANDAEMTDADWYALLTEAEAKWWGILATHVPEYLMGPPTLMVTEDAGETYVFSTSENVWPIEAEIRASRNGRVLTPGPEWGYHNDYVLEASSVAARIRIPNGKQRSYAGGPYARWIQNHDLFPAISSTEEPHLNPPHARNLVVLDAVIAWANRGAGRDPRPYERELQILWEGHPNMGSDPGMLAQLKSQVFGAGVPHGYGNHTWYHSPDLG